MDNIELSFADGVLDYIVDKAVEFKLGARGLRSICEAIMMDIMFETPSKITRPQTGFRWVISTRGFTTQK